VPLRLHPRSGAVWNRRSLIPVSWRVPFKRIVIELAKFSVPGWIIRECRLMSRRWTSVPGEVAVVWFQAVSRVQPLRCACVRFGNCFGGGPFAGKILSKPRPERCQGAVALLPGRVRPSLPPEAGSSGIDYYWLVLPSRPTAIPYFYSSASRRFRYRLEQASRYPVFF